VAEEGDVVDTRFQCCETDLHQISNADRPIDHMRSQHSMKCRRGQRWENCPSVKRVHCDKM